VTRVPRVPTALEPNKDEVATMMASATSFVTDFLGSLGEAPATAPDDSCRGLAELLAPPDERPVDFDHLLDVFGDAASRAVETAGPGCYAYFPGGGLFASAVAELLACTVNRYTGLSSMAPGLVALEDSVIRWFCREFGLPAGAGGLLTTGTSASTLSALVAARQRQLGGPPKTGAIYLTEHTHHCVAKAAHIAGFGPEQIRTVPVTADHRMDPAAAEELIAADRAAGRRPFVLVGTAGTTNTGTIDPLADLAALADRQGVWFHVDAAYGGGFQLTERGRTKLRGIERADSVTVDPHKSLFLPYSTGLLLVRDVRSLRAAHGADADYLQDVDHDTGLPDYADLGAELTRDFRGLRLWLPLHLYGAGAFRTALDEKLDLAEVAYRELRDMPRLQTYPPDLTVLAFRSAGGDEVNRRLLDTIHASGRIALTSTQIDDQCTLRLCVLSHRTHRAHVDEAIAIVRDALRTTRSALGQRQL